MGNITATLDQNQQLVYNNTGINSIDPYRLVNDAYYGTGGFRTGAYLVSHERETDYTERKGYSFYTNYFKPIINSLINPIWKSTIERSFENDTYARFVEDCNKNGLHLNKFTKDLAKRAKINGAAFVIMDTQRDQPRNLKEAIEKRTFPYIYTKPASDCVWYEVTKWGELVGIAFKELAGNDEFHDQESTDLENKTQYRVWSKGKWEVYKKYESGKFKEKISEGIVNNNILPVIPLVLGESETGSILPEPPLYDIARINAAIYNKWSELREVQRKQGFSILTLPVSLGPQNQSLTIGTSSVLVYPKDSSREPKFIQPDVEIQMGLIKGIEKLTEEMYKQAKLAGVTGVVQQSGIAKQWDFEATDTELNDLARDIERTEILIANLFQKLTGQNFDFSVSYPETFGVIDIDADILRAENFLSLGMPDDVAKEVKKDLLLSYFSHKDPHERDRLVNSLDSFTEDKKRADIQDNDQEDQEETLD